MKIFFMLAYSRSRAERPVFTDVITDQIQEIADRMSRALTIDMFSFDLMISGGKPYVVDVGAFGGFMGVPRAAEMVAARIIRAWEERAT